MMETTDTRYQAYLNILKEELVPAMGCTEPIAVAYAAARAAVENTIANIGRLGRDGMRETDKEIIRMMLGQ